MNLSGLTSEFAYCNLGIDGNRQKRSWALSVLGSASLGWVKWGFITRQPTGTSGNFSYGFGAYGGWDGAHGGSFITVNVKGYPDANQVSTGLSEAFENITATQNIGGKPSSMTIQYHAVLNAVGKDLFAYIFA